MATPSTACVDMVAALRSVLAAYRTANPNSLRAVFTARPGGVGEVPFAFIGGRDEQINHSEGIRDRTFTPTVVVVDSYAGDNEQATDRLDILQDALVDAFTANPHALAGGLVQQTSVRDGDISFGIVEVTWYRARTFVFDRVLISEGRV